MSFAQTGSSVNKKRIIYFSRSLCYCYRYCMCIFIRISYYKIFKIKTRVEEFLLIERVLHPCCIYLINVVFFFLPDYYSVWFIKAAVKCIFNLIEVMFVQMID